MPNGSSKRVVEKKMSGAFILRIAERACTMDIDPSITQIQKWRNCHASKGFLQSKLGSKPPGEWYCEHGDPALRLGSLPKV